MSGQREEYGMKLYIVLNHDLGFTMDEWDLHPEEARGSFVEDLFQMKKSK